MFKISRIEQGMNLNFSKKILFMKDIETYLLKVNIKQNLIYCKCKNSNYC